MNRRLRAEWLDFSGKLLRHAPEIQRVEMRRAFYAGAVSIVDTMAKAMSQGDEPSASDLKAIEDLQAEIGEYLTDLQEGRA